MDTDKPIIVLTSFWDAESIISDGYVLFDYNGQTARINFIDSPSKNFSVSSIALSHPDFNSKKMHNVENSFDGRIDVFCPKWNMLKQYKEKTNDYEWSDYESDYYTILKKRSKEIRNWVDSLEPNHVYILCCWENTSVGVHCHREILYDAFSKSKTINDRAIVLFRDGKKKYKRNAQIIIQGQSHYSADGIGYGPPVVREPMRNPVRTVVEAADDEAPMAYDLGPDLPLSGTTFTPAAMMAAMESELDMDANGEMEEMETEMGSEYPPEYPPEYFSSAIEVLVDDPIDISDGGTQVGPPVEMGDVEWAMNAEGEIEESTGPNDYMIGVDPASPESESTGVSLSHAISIEVNYDAINGIATSDPELRTNDNRTDLEIEMTRENLPYDDEGDPTNPF